MMYQYDIVKRSKTVIVVRETYDMYARYAHLLDANIAGDLHRGKADIDGSAYRVVNIGIEKQRIGTMRAMQREITTYIASIVRKRDGHVLRTTRIQIASKYGYIYIRRIKQSKTAGAATKTDDAQACRPSMSNRAFLQCVCAQAPSMIILSASSAINSPLVGLSLDE